MHQDNKKSVSIHQKLPISEAQLDQKLKVLLSHITPGNPALLAFVHSLTESEEFYSFISLLAKRSNYLPYFRDSALDHTWGKIAHSLALPEDSACQSIQYPLDRLVYSFCHSQYMKAEHAKQALRRIHHYSQQEDYVAALFECQNLANDANLSLKQLYIYVLWQSGKRHHAIAEIEQLLRNNPNNITLLENSIYMHYRLQQYEAANARAEKLIVLNGSPTAYFVMGDYCLRTAKNCRSNFIRGIMHYNTLYKLYKDRVEQRHDYKRMLVIALTAKSVLLFNRLYSLQNVMLLKNYQEEIEFLEEQVNKVDTTNYYLNICLAKLFNTLGMHTKADRYLNNISSNINISADNYTFLQLTKNLQNYLASNLQQVFGISDQKISGIYKKLCLQSTQTQTEVINLATKLIRNLEKENQNYLVCENSATLFSSVDQIRSCNSGETTPPSLHLIHVNT